MVNLRSPKAIGHPYVSSAKDLSLNNFTGISGDNNAQTTKARASHSPTKHRVKFFH
jgi:hypothetical protein